VTTEGMIREADGLRVEFHAPTLGGCARRPHSQLALGHEVRRGRPADFTAFGDDPSLYMHPEVRPRYAKSIRNRFVGA
jgi:hypothetical protein